MRNFKKETLTRKQLGRDVERLIPTQEGGRGSFRIRPDDILTNRLIRAAQHPNATGRPIARTQSLKDIQMVDIEDQQIRLRIKRYAGIGVSSITTARCNGGAETSTDHRLKVGKLI